MEEFAKMNVRTKRGSSPSKAVLYKGKCFDGSTAKDDDGFVERNVFSSQEVPKHVKHLVGVLHGLDVSKRVRERVTGTGQ